MKKSLLLIFGISQFCMAELYVSNVRLGYLGDCMMSFAIAKAISLQYKIDFQYHPFEYSHLFVLDETQWAGPAAAKAEKISFDGLGTYEQNVELYKNLAGTYVLPAYCLTPVGCHVSNEIVQEIRRLVQPKHAPAVAFPHDQLTVGVHIRKGNGGGKYYDGELTSLQLFDHDYPVIYNPVTTHAFESLIEYDIFGRQRWTMDAGYTMLSLKFPPEQYYVDQIKKVSSDLGDRPFCIWIVTDDKTPSMLVKRIKKAVNKPNITYRYLYNRKKTHNERIIEDLWCLAQCNGLIRSQSHFAKIAELMGNHEFVFFSGSHKWVDKKMIITGVATKNYQAFLDHHRMTQ